MRFQPKYLRIFLALFSVSLIFSPALAAEECAIGFAHFSRDDLTRSATSLVNTLGKRVDRLYYTSGFKAEEDLLQAIRREGPKAEAWLDRIEGEKVDFAMRAPLRARRGIARDGFRNMHEIGDTRGGYSQFQRDRLESFASLGKPDEYSETVGGLKPKYGYLRRAPSEGIPDGKKSAVYNYGPDIYVFKKDRLRDRTTWTAGDSGALYFRKEEIKSPKKWDDLFIPWQSRELIVPLLDQGTEALKVVIPSYPPGSPLRKFKKHSPSTAYVELQFWGPVDLDDVERFEFTGRPPKDEFLIELQRRNIPIFDSRKGMPVRWSP